MTILHPTTAKWLSIIWLICSFAVDCITPAGYGIATLYIMVIVFAGDTTSVSFLEMCLRTSVVAMILGCFVPYEPWDERLATIFVIHRMLPAGVMFSILIAARNYIWVREECEVQHRHSREVF